MKCALHGMETVVAFLLLNFVVVCRERWARSPGITSCCSLAFPQSSASSQSPNNCCVLSSDKNDENICIELAQKLRLPLLLNDEDVDSKNFNHALQIIPYQWGPIKDYALAIDMVNNDSSHRHRRRVDKSRNAATTKPYFVDFCPFNDNNVQLANNRLTKQQLSTDLLIKAVAPQRGCKDGIFIVDATAGFGKDALLMAHASGTRKVLMIERDLVIGALLQDGLRRLSMIAEHDAKAAKLSKILKLVVGDSIEILKKLKLDAVSSRPDVIYLDPMFPPRTKSAAVKKNMQILHSLLDTQHAKDDAYEHKRLQQETTLFNSACSVATKRVVVKRPINAKEIQSDGPTRSFHSVRGSINRWDVYNISPAIDRVV